MWCRAKTTTIWHGDMVPEGARVEMSDDAKPNPNAWVIEHPIDVQDHDEHEAKAKRRGRPKKQNMSK